MSTDAAIDDIIGELMHIRAERELARQTVNVVA